MSWHGGRRVFHPVVEGIEQLEEGEISSKDLIVILIKALKAEDWDVNEAEVGGLEEDSPAREALREFGVVETCGAEHETEPWQCEEEKGHSPATPHKDYRGKTWSDKENG